MKLHQLQKLLALLFSFALIAAACGGSEEGGTETDTDEETSEETTATTAADTEVEEVVVEDGRTYGGDISVGLEAESTGLRPWEDTCASPCYNIIRSIHDTLFEIDTNFEPQPFLAASSSVNADFTEYVVTLREGVTFHDGSAFTAQTVVDMFAIQLTGAASSGPIGSANLAEVTATGDLEVTYALSDGNSAFLAFLTRAPIGAVFEPGAAAADPDGYSNAPVGTGPFVLESRDLDNETVVVKNDNWWGTSPDGDALPYLDSITFRPIPDETTRLDSLLSGTVDAFQTLRQGTIRDALEQDGIELIQFQGNNTGGGHFNTAVAPYDDVRVRRGLVHLNPQDRVIEALGGTGISLPATQWFSPDSPWYSEAVAEAWPQFDFDGGVALIQEYVDDPERSDGKAVGEKIDVELSCPPDPTLIASMQVIEEVWTGSELINVSLTNFDQQTHINNALGAPPEFTGTHGAHCWRWSSDDDPSLGLNPFLAPPSPDVAEAAGIPGVVSPVNFSNWFNGEAFGAAVTATKTDDFDQRYALYESIMLTIADEVPIWYTGHTATAFGVTPGLVGLNGWHLPSGELGAGIPAVEGRYHEVSLEPAE